MNIHVQGAQFWFDVAFKKFPVEVSQDSPWPKTTSRNDLKQVGALSMFMIPKTHVQVDLSNRQYNQHYRKKSQLTKLTLDPKFIKT